VTRVLSFVLFLIISNKAIATVKGVTLICDKDRRGYDFISNDKVIVSGINLDELDIISIKHSYELTENAIFIKQTLKELNKEKITKLVGWIFRRTLDYVSLDYTNGDWSRKFLWSCEILLSNQLERRLKNTLDKLKKAKDKK
tara:strand:- start:78 stop:503 length:426 start_codon:yes stop_codon:yes gene_type:complete